MMTGPFFGQFYEVHVGFVCLMHGKINKWHNWVAHWDHEPIYKEICGRIMDRLPSSVWDREEVLRSIWYWEFLYTRHLSRMLIMEDLPHLKGELRFEKKKKIFAIKWL